MNKSINSDTLKDIAKKTKGYTGAEIEQIVKASLRKAFVRASSTGTTPELKKIDLEEAITQVVPISKSSKEKINALDLWASGRALYANKREKKTPKIDVNTDIL